MVYFSENVFWLQMRDSFMWIIRSPRRLVDGIRLFTRYLWALADVALWRHRGHFGAQTNQKLSNHTWNWEQRNQVTASRVYSLRWGAKPSLHAGQKSLRMKLHLANLTGGNISLRMHCYIESLTACLFPEESYDGMLNLIQLFNLSETKNLRFCQLFTT